MTKATHSITLHVQVGDPEQLKELRSRFCLQLKALPDDLPYSNLTVFNLDGFEEDNDGGEYHDENTMIKLREALNSVLLEDEVDAAVNAMQNAGILFREKRPVE